jgi:hypothetical protein
MTPSRVVLLLRRLLAVVAVELLHLPPGRLALLRLRRRLLLLLLLHLSLVGWFESPALA